ncbi:MAG: hypothetical protein ACRDNL_16415, partial [Spirillospora sp.]
MPPIRTPTRRELGRAGAAAVLLAAGAYGVRGLDALWSGLTVAEPSTPSIITVAVLASATAVLIAAALRGHRDEPVFGRWTKPLTAGFVLLVLGLPLALLYTGLRDPLYVFVQRKDRGKRKPLPDVEREAPWLVPSTALWTLIAVALIVLAAAIALVLVLYRHELTRRWHRQR